MRNSLSSLLLVLLPLIFVACSDSTTPTPVIPGDGGAAFDGVFDPDGDSFVLQRIDHPVAGREPVPIDLIGSNVQVDQARETVSVDVAMRNAGREPLYAPVSIWVNRFVPPEVAVLNADYVRESVDPLDPADIFVTYGFDYSDLLGEDGVLEPDESSQPRTWTFHDPGLASFSFVAEADFGMEPNRPVIPGMLFSDDNRNGIRDEGEGPFFPGGVTVQFPDGSAVSASPDDLGFYRVRVTEPGLYRVMFTTMLDCIACICETTPNPLEVFITPGPDGEPRGFEDADFGIYPGPCIDLPKPVPPRVVLTDRPPGEIDQDFYQLISAELDGQLFRVRAGYSGCSRGHPFTLYAGRRFMESAPVQTWMLLAHDDLGELCLAYFEETLVFDLGPIQEAHIEDYGEPGIIRLRFRDFLGVESEFLLGSELVTMTGVVTRIDDAIPVDGGVVIEVLLDGGETARLFFDSLFTEPPPPQWKLDLYGVIAGLEIGDRVRATGATVDGGLSLRGLVILDR